MRRCSWRIGILKSAKSRWSHKTPSLVSTYYRAQLRFSAASVIDYPGGTIRAISEKIMDLQDDRRSDLIILYNLSIHFH